MEKFAYLLFYFFYKLYENYLIENATWTAKIFMFNANLNAIGWCLYSRRFRIGIYSSRSLLAVTPGSKEVHRRRQLFQYFEYGLRINAY